MILRTFLAGAVVIGGALGFANAASAITLKGHCTVSASVHGGKNFATLKCDKEDQPGDYVIRSTVWEKDDVKGYRDLARFSGRKFTCDLTDGGRTRGVGVETTHFKLSNCH
jgi:hypothetical protein